MLLNCSLLGGEATIDFFRKNMTGVIHPCMFYSSLMFFATQRDQSFCEGDLVVGGVINGSGVRVCRDYHVSNSGRHVKGILAAEPHKSDPPRINIQWTYRKTSSINRTKSQTLNVSCILLQLSSRFPLKPDVKLRIKIQLEQRRQAMLQLHLSYQQFIA